MRIMLQSNLGDSQEYLMMEEGYKFKFSEIAMLDETSIIIGAYVRNNYPILVYRNSPFGQRAIAEYKRFSRIAP
jgi:hypothetical protein